MFHIQRQRSDEVGEAISQAVLTAAALDSGKDGELSIQVEVVVKYSELVIHFPDANYTMYLDMYSENDLSREAVVVGAELAGMVRKGE